LRTVELILLLIFGILLVCLSLLVPSYPSRRRKAKSRKKAVGKDPVRIALKSLRKQK